MSSANKPFEIREARIGAARSSANLYVEPGQSVPEVGARFRISGRRLEPGQGGSDLWQIVSIVKIPGTGMWCVDFTSPQR